MASTFKPSTYRSTHLETVTDLTVRAPLLVGPVPGIADSAPLIERLGRVLRVLDAVRKAARELSPRPSPFDDPVVRFHDIHFFRFGLDPDGQGGGHLLLNVTFDGGWEPYMRLIWGPLGSLLDLMYCHCQNYPGAWRCSFDDYMRWVRSVEVPSQFFFTDSSSTVGDRVYRERLDALALQQGGPDLDRLAAELAAPPRAGRAVPSAYAAQVGLEAVRAFYSLRSLFPSLPSGRGAPHTPTDQAGYLLRCTHDLLAEFHGWVVTQHLFDAGGPFERLGRPFAAELAWFGQPRHDRRVGQPWQQERLALFPPGALPDPALLTVQAGVLRPFPPGTVHGALVLLHVVDADQARRWLNNGLAVSAGADHPPLRGIFRNVALTLTGLRALGVHADRLEALPQEFLEGMEARAGLLGDIRGQHPRAWRRPRLNWPADAAGRLPKGLPPVDLAAVHVLVQLRTDDRPDDSGGDGVVLLGRLTDELNGWDEAATGLSLLHVQPLRARLDANGIARGHFDFADGISQPTLESQPGRQVWSDQVPRGEVLLGYGNGRGDGPVPAVDGPDGNLLLDHGSFLAVRKLRQHRDRLDHVLDDATAQVALQVGLPRGQVRDELRDRMMGRRSNGEPLTGPAGAGVHNDFDYRADPAGQRCPLQSHVRRANSRAPLPDAAPPRIVRRGMSYGPAVDGAADAAAADPAAAPVERGLLFLAYNASLAEQFEVIQRWLSGGNATGLSTLQSDPFLGAADDGQPRVFRCTYGGEVVRVDLGVESLVQLEWGLYAFVPSLPALRHLAEGHFAESAVAGKVPPPPSLVYLPGAGSEPAPEVMAAKLQMESRGSRVKAWAAAAACPANRPVNKGAYGWLVGATGDVRKVLGDDGSRFSVSGYGQRMRDSLGLGFLGQDDVGLHAGHGEPWVESVNRAVEDFGQGGAAFEAARRATQAVIEAGFLAIPPGLPQQWTADIEALSMRVIARLCAEWFGLPDAAGQLMGIGGPDAAASPKAQCPIHFLNLSRHVFSPHPRQAVEATAPGDGAKVHDAVRVHLAARAGLAQPPGDLTSAMLEALDRHAVADPEVRASTVAGIMLGFPGTVFGNLVNVMMSWQLTRRLWDLQLKLRRLERAGPLDARRVREGFEADLLAAMREDTVPHAVWRVAAADAPCGWAGVSAGDKVVVGLGAALTPDGRNDDLIFGGHRPGAAAGGPAPTPHACSGRDLALDTMLGLFVALWQAGELRPDTDPRRVIVVR